MKPVRLIWIPLFLALLASGCSGKPGVGWIKFSPEKMNESAQMDRPTVLYFYAAWCSMCYYMKKNTFTDPRLIEALGPFTRFKVDVSFVHSQKIIDLMQRYGIQGVPAVVVLDRQGREIFRIRGYADADQFLRYLEHYRVQLV